MTMMTRRSGRNSRRIDYAALNESSTLQELNVHPQINNFKNFKSIEPLNELICLINDDDTTNEYKQYYNSNGQFDDESLRKLVEDTRLVKPILIRGANPQIKETYNENIKISFNIPNNDIEELTEKIGSNVKVPVMDVMTQNNSPRWDMKRWCEYFSTEKDKRDKIRNVISLEISDTKLGEEIKIPKVVEELDIISKLFENEGEGNDENLSEMLIRNGINKPKVQKYILMSVEGSFTDFHIDFAGTSVYYSPICGHKKFLMIPPLNSNLKAYSKWCLSDNQNKIWFPSLIKQYNRKEFIKMQKEEKLPNAYLNNGFIVDIMPGDLLLLPSMWIHSVLTVKDSLIIGGNFLNLLSLENHLKAHKIEMETRVNDQFKFPNFIKFIWIIAYYLRENININLGEDSSYGIKCYENLVNFLHEQWRYVNSKTLLKREKHNANKIKYSIPRDIVGHNIEEFLKSMDQWLSGNSNSNSNKRQRIT